MLWRVAGGVDGRDGDVADTDLVTVVQPLGIELVLPVLSTLT